jgi:hypothetical protein
MSNTTRRKPIFDEATRQGLASALDGAVQIAGIKTEPPCSAPTTRKFLSALKEPREPGNVRGNLPPEIYGPANRLTPYSEKTLSTVLCNVELLPRAQVATFRKLQEQYEATLAEAEKYSTPAANTYHRQQVNRLSATIAEGGTFPEDLTTRSRDGVHEDFRARRQILGRKLSEITTAAFAIAGPVIARAEQVITDYMATLEESERGTAEQFGIAYEPSALWRALACATLRFASDRTPAHGASMQPRAMLAGLVTI